MEIEVENKFVKIFDGVFEKLGTEEISKIQRLRPVDKEALNAKEGNKDKSIKQLKASDPAACIPENDQSTDWTQDQVDEQCLIKHSLEQFPVFGISFDLWNLSA